ncbi:MAG: VOC family protein [Paracoccaceae bacterium]
MTAPFVPVGVDHLVLWVRDLDAARAWYVDVLGCRPGYEYPEIGMTHVWYGPVLIGLWDADDPAAAASVPDGTGANLHHVALGFVGASMAQVRAHLARHGVEVLRDIRQTGSRGFGEAVYLRDPWDNLIELKAAAEFRAPTDVPASENDPAP